MMRAAWTALFAVIAALACGAQARAQVGTVNVCAPAGDTLAPRAIPGAAMGDHVLLRDGRVVLPSEIEPGFVALEPSFASYARDWSPPWKLSGKLGYVPIGLRHPAPDTGLALGGSAGGTPYLVDPQANAKRPMPLYLLTPGCRLQLLMPGGTNVDVRDPCARSGEPVLVTPDELRKRRVRHRQHPRASDPPRCR